MVVAPTKPVVEFTVITDRVYSGTLRFDLTYSMFWKQLRSWQAVPGHEAGYCRGVMSRRIAQLGDTK